MSDQPRTSDDEEADELALEPAQPGKLKLTPVEPGKLKLTPAPRRPKRDSTV